MARNAVSVGRCVIFACSDARRKRFPSKIPVVFSPTDWKSPRLFIEPWFYSSVYSTPVSRSPIHDFLAEMASAVRRKAAERRETERRS